MMPETPELSTDTGLTSTPLPAGQERAVSTITDVASLAGVSIATASKAMNGKSGVSDVTRRRVLEAADKLRFRSNQLAANLVTGRSFTVGLITNDSYGRFAMPVMLGAEDALEAGKIAIFLCDGRDDPIREDYYVRTLLGRRVDGIIVTGKVTDPRRPIKLSYPVPVVYANCESQDPRDVSIVTDDERGARLAVEHLLAMGRRNIAHISGGTDLRAARERSSGALKALKDAELPMVGQNPFFGAWSEEWGYQAAHIVLRTCDSVNGIFCGSDQIARGVVDGVQSLGRRVPEDIAVVGIDNWKVVAEASRPPLTTVDLNLSQVGRLAAELLLAAIEGQAVEGRRLVAPSLIVRESTRVTADAKR
jgi:LacI family transcriptional regulator